MTEQNSKTSLNLFLFKPGSHFKGPDTVVNITYLKRMRTWLPQEKEIKTAGF